MTPPASAAENRPDPEPDIVRVAGAVHVLARAAERFRARLGAGLELGATDVAALWEIHVHQEIRPGELAAALGLGIAGTSSIIDKLVSRSLVRRGPLPHDRRTYALTLTSAGRFAVDWLNERTCAVVAEVLGGRPASGRGRPAGTGPADRDLSPAALADLMRTLGSAFADGAAQL